MSTPEEHHLIRVGSKWVTVELGLSDRLILARRYESPEEARPDLATMRGMPHRQSTTVELVKLTVLVVERYDVRGTRDRLRKCPCGKPHDHSDECNSPALAATLDFNHRDDVPVCCGFHSLGGPHALPCTFP